MRFSAAILQIAPRDPARARPLPTGTDEHPPAEPQEPERRVVQEPPPDLDQRVRLSGEW